MIERVFSTLTETLQVLVWPYAVVQVTVTVWAIPEEAGLVMVRTPLLMLAPENSETDQVLVEEFEALMVTDFPLGLFL